MVRILLDLDGLGWTLCSEAVLVWMRQREIEKARFGASKAGIAGSQQPGNADLPKQGETPTGTFKRLRDTTTARMTYTLGGGCEELIVTSAYLPYDSNEPPPSKELRDIVEYSELKEKQLIIGCDANAHHILWGSTDINPREQCLMEYLVCSKLNIPNQGNETTFVVCKRQEVIDLTLGTNKIGNLISNWHVSDEPSISDHR
ncbi:hypothetical protein B7P43_G18092 [Cryptotermes secundus]|uniref:Endonuclease/exonuclease/phosphatase domain-containing protein n=1 Tax=Cryptotermes secundus TaxID=105785 RepID=A0A2J7QVK1_9NEOP|nr:hypothetical protein B7P43_G18092 [Cryptotermes secundus]